MLCNLYYPLLGVLLAIFLSCTIPLSSALHCVEGGGPRSVSFCTTVVSPAGSVCRKLWNVASCIFFRFSMIVADLSYQVLNHVI